MLKWSWVAFRKTVMCLKQSIIGGIAMGARPGPPWPPLPHHANTPRRSCTCEPCTDIARAQEKVGPFGHAVSPVAKHQLTSQMLQPSLEHGALPQRCCVAIPVIRVVRGQKNRWESGARYFGLDCTQISRQDFASLNHVLCH